MYTIPKSKSTQLNIMCVKNTFDKNISLLAYDTFYRLFLQLYHLRKIHFQVIFKSVVQRLPEYYIITHLNVCLTESQNRNEGYLSSVYQTFLHVYLLLITFIVTCCRCIHVRYFGLDLQQCCPSTQDKDTLILNWKKDRYTNFTQYRNNE